MKTTTNTHLFTDKKEANNTGDIAIPTVYFRGVNRIQINRFKAYLLILSNRLNKSWHVTQDIKSANIVVDWASDQNSNEKYLRMSVLSATANLKPPVISSFKLSFEENQLCHLLNKASKQLLIAHNDYVVNKPNHETVKVVGLINESLSQICALLNEKNSGTQFLPSVGIFSTKSDIFNEKLLLIIDPIAPDSIRAYQSLLQKQLNGDIVINELTIAIISRSDNSSCEEIFDKVYDNADDNTQITLVNFEDEKELNSFVTYF